MSRQNYEYLYQIKDSIDRIIESTSNIDYQDFEVQKMVQDFVVYKFEIISHACLRLSDEIKNKIDFIPWERIINIRSKLINDYFEVNISKVWEIIKEDLPILRDDINKVIDKVNQSTY